MVLLIQHTLASNSFQLNVSATLCGHLQWQGTKTQSSHQYIHKQLKDEEVPGYPRKHTQDEEQ